MDRIQTTGLIQLFGQCFFSIQAGLINNRLFMNNEWFHQLPGGIQMSSRILSKLLKSDQIETLFDVLRQIQVLGLSEVEMALLVPILLTVSLEYLDETSGLRQVVQTAGGDFDEFLFQVRDVRRVYMDALFAELRQRMSRLGIIELTANIVQVRIFWYFI
jgi:hypothetical protein